MKVSLIDFTGCGHPNPADYAANLLIFTKNTRLNMSPGLMAELAAWPYEHKMTVLETIAATIPSSHEFVNYTFLIEGVTRGFTHQFVRGRHASYAQQTMRVLDVSTGPGWEYATGPSVIARGDDQVFNYKHIMALIANAYKGLIAAGVAVEDARGVLPTNILTNIVAAMNLRTFSETVRKRSSPRVQGEYREVLAACKEAVLAVHPWTSMFFSRTFDNAAQELDIELQKVEDKEQRLKMMKLVDLMRGQA